MRKTRLSRVSKKRSVELQKYSKLKTELLGGYGCEFEDCWHEAEQVHHMRGRGKHLNDTGTWLLVCSEHHRWIHDHAREARKMGLIKYV